jgi:hypothetical protein
VRLYPEAMRVRQPENGTDCRPKRKGAINGECNMSPNKWMWDVDVTAQIRDANSGSALKLLTEESKPSAA